MSQLLTESLRSKKDREDLRVLLSGFLDTKYESDIAILRTKTQWLLLALGLVFLFIVPLFASDYYLSWLTVVAVAIVAVLGLHILTGLCGIFPVGHAAFMGVGAYSVAILTTRYELSGRACLPLSLRWLPARRAYFLDSLPSD